MSTFLFGWIYTVYDTRMNEVIEQNEYMDHLNCDE